MPYKIIINKWSTKARNPNESHTTVSDMGDTLNSDNALVSFAASNLEESQINFGYLKIQTKTVRPERRVGEKNVSG